MNTIFNFIIVIAATLISIAPYAIIGAVSYYLARKYIWKNWDDDTEDTAQDLTNQKTGQ